MTRGLLAVCALLACGTLASAEDRPKLTDAEKIEWYCSEHPDEGPNCPAHARLLLPYIPDYKTDAQENADPCGFSPPAPGCPGAPPAQAPAPPSASPPAPPRPNPPTAPAPGGPPAAGCPASSGAVDFDLKLSGADVLRLPSGQIATAVLDRVREAGGTTPSGQVIFGETTVSPRAATLEISISKCRGVIRPSADGCYLSTNNPTFATLIWLEEPVKGMEAYNLCKAYASKGRHYVNVRYTYAASACRFGTCGFVNQWNFAGYGERR